MKNVQSLTLNPGKINVWIQIRADPWTLDQHCVSHFTPGHFVQLVHINPKQKRAKVRIQKR